MAMSAALTRQNLFSQVHINIFNLLNDRDNVGDPRDPSGLTRKDFVVANADDNERSQETFPLVVVKPPNTRIGELRLGDDLNATVSGELIVEVWSTITFDRQKTAANYLGRGPRDLDRISDDIMQTLNSVTNRNSLRANNIGSVVVDTRSTEHITTKDETVWFREIAVSFETRLLQVSA